MVRVDTLDELAATLALFAHPRRVSGGEGVAIVTDSGGERELLVDLAADLGVPLATLSAATEARLAARLAPGQPVRCLGHGARFRGGVQGLRHNSRR